MAHADATTDADFQARCHAAGVVNCQGFDTSAIFGTAVNANAPSDGFSSANEPNWSLDTTNFISGGGSAHCSIPASTGQNPCEDYWAMFGQGSNVVNIGQGQTFYVQFAFRADSTWTTTDWTKYGPQGDNTAPKIVIFDNVQNSCDVTEITTHNHDAKDLPIVYTDCGDLTGTSADGTTWNEDGQYWQQGWLSPAPFTGYQCAYNNSNFNGPNCFTFVANQWYTFYYKVTIGTWNGANSTIDAWVAPYGQQLKQWVSLANYNFGGNDNDCNAAGTGAGSLPCGFNNLHLTQFMTDKNGNDGSPAANVWYDELIISTQPIAQPGGTLSPPPPPPPPPPTISPCDVNGDGQVNVADVQKEVMMALQLSPCTNPDSQCTVIQVEDVVNAVLGGTCVSP